MGYKKILVPLDGSKLSELALQHVMQVAEPKAYVRVLSVMAEDRPSEISSLATAKGQAAKLTTDTWPPIDAADPQSTSGREDYLRRVSEWLEQLGITVSTEVRTGNVVETIAEVARAGKFDVIIIATHARTGLNRVALGSVAEGVLERAPCAVLIVPPPAA